MDDRFYEHSAASDRDRATKDRRHDGTVSDILDALSQEQRDENPEFSSNGFVEETVPPPPEGPFDELVSPEILFPDGVAELD